MTLAAPRLRSFDELYEEIERLPSGATGEILQPGTLRVMSRPGRGHRLAAKQILHGLGGFDVDRGGVGWWIEVEPEIRFPDDRLFVPDLAGWRVEHLPQLPEDNPLTVIPDWVCEVHSASTRRDDRHVKLPTYATHGVGFIWMVDPDTRLVEVYSPSTGRPRLITSAAGDEPALLPPFDEAFNLARWWPATTNAPP